MEDFQLLPKEYIWLKSSGLIGFGPTIDLSPWRLIKTEHIFDFYKGMQEDKLIAFARREDCDDFVCFKITANKASYVLVHNWTPDGFDETLEFNTIWEWIKSTVDDIEECYNESNP